jgi:lysophospholipase L1-like esterase
MTVLFDQLPCTKTASVLLKRHSMKNIIFFGDSLTAGHGLPAAQSFPSLVQQRLDALPLPYKAYNYGVSGETSAGGRPATRLMRSCWRSGPTTAFAAFRCAKPLITCSLSSTL